LDGQRGEDAVWWALIHILEEWAKKSQCKRKSTDYTPRLTPKKPTTSGPPGQLEPSGQPGPSGKVGLSGQREPFTPDYSIRTAVLNPTTLADPTPAANPTHEVDPIPTADLTPAVHPPIITRAAVRCRPVRTPPVCPLPVRPPPMGDTLGGLFAGGLQGLDDHNPPAKWVAQSQPIWPDCRIHIANYGRLHNHVEDTIRILGFLWSHGTIRRLELQDVSPLGRPGERYIGQLYMSGWLPPSSPWERMVSIEWDEAISTWLKPSWGDDIPNPGLLELPHAAPEANGGRLQTSVWWILC